MMDLNFFIGLLWSIILVIGAARPEPKKVIKPIQSTKNRLFFMGAIFMLTFSWLGYYNGWSIFFFILEIFMILSSILMMLGTKDKINTLILSASGLALIIRSWFLFQWYSTMIFIIWLIGIWLGYAFKMGSIRREGALVLWSLLVALFSFLEPNRIFFRLNIFFALFSSYYLVKAIQNNQTPIKKSKRK